MEATKILSIINEIKKNKRIKNPQKITKKYIVNVLKEINNSNKNLIALLLNEAAKKSNMNINEYIEFLMNTRIKHLLNEIIFDSISIVLNKQNFDYITKHYKLSESLIETHSDKINWELVSIYQTLSENFIEKHQDKVDWEWISEFQKLSEHFIDKHSKKICWDKICKHQNLSEHLIEKYIDEIDWVLISKYQNLSEKFIEKYLDDLYLKYIFKHQKLSEEFIENIKNKIKYK